MGDKILQFEKVSKSYDENLIFEDISFDLEIGKSLCIKAPSGKGKSTLLSIAGLLLQPSYGQVIFDGTDTTKLMDKDMSKIRCTDIGFLFQHTQLAGALRAHENVSLSANFADKSSRGLSRSEIDERKKELLDRFGLMERYYYFPSQLSIGQKRRIACARALFMNPELIIADEPTNDLDEENKKILVDALFEPVVSGSSALLFATHDEELARKADSIIEL